MRLYYGRGQEALPDDLHCLLDDQALSVESWPDKNAVSRLCCLYGSAHRRVSARLTGVDRMRGHNTSPATSLTPRFSPPSEALSGAALRENPVV